MKTFVLNYELQIVVTSHQILCTVKCRNYIILYRCVGRNLGYSW